MLINGTPSTWTGCRVLQRAAYIVSVQQHYTIVVDFYIFAAFFLFFSFVLYFRAVENRMAAEPRFLSRPFMSFS
jgi:hypothetical protein